MYGGAYEPELPMVEAAEEQDDLDIGQEDAWAVISAYFQEKGLVRQQLDSFDDFVNNTIQDILDETPEMVIKPENQYTAEQTQIDEGKEYRIKFGQIYMAKPVMTEQGGDEETKEMFPNQSRLRNLT